MLLVLLIALLSACAAATTSPPAGLAPISADGARLLAGGRPFEVRGINYIRPSTADPQRCPDLQFGADGNCPWSLAPIEADFDRLRALGVNTVRIFLNYYAFGGAREVDPAYDIARPLAELDRLIAAAEQRDIYVLPVLLAKYPQDRFGPEHYATALDLHVRPVVQHLTGRPAILAWDLFNEPDIGSPIDIRCWDWDNGDFPLCFELAEERMRFIAMLHDEVKRLDPQRLTTTGLAFAKNYAEPAEASMRLADVVDLYTFHYYDNDPYDSGRYAAHWYYGQGFPADQRRAIEELAALQPQRPIIITEIGFPTAPEGVRSSDDLRRDLRIALQTARDERIAGMVLWPFQWPPEELVGDLFTK